MKIFIVGEYLGYHKNLLWRYHRVVDNEKDAKEACVNEEYFYIPIDHYDFLSKVDFNKDLIYPNV